MSYLQICKIHKSNYNCPLKLFVFGLVERLWSINKVTNWQERPKDAQDRGASLHTSTYSGPGHFVSIHSHISTY